MDSVPARRTTLVWDLPTRLSHWLMASTLIGAFALALVTKKSGDVFPVHMLLGAIATLLVLLRVVWGFAGSTYARFRSFVYGPRAITRYFRGLVSRSRERWVGHNPGSSAAIFGMLGLLLATGVTGALAATAPSWVRELHPILAYVLIGVAAAHILGVLLHTFSHRENIILSMVDGRKAPVVDSPPIRSTHPVVALAFLAIVGAFGTLAISSYDASSRSLVIPVVHAKLLLQPPRKARPPARSEGATTTIPTGPRAP